MMPIFEGFINKKFSANFVVKKRGYIGPLFLIFIYFYLAIIKICIIVKFSQYFIRFFLAPKRYHLLAFGHRYNIVILGVFVQFQLFVARAQYLR